MKDSQRESVDTLLEAKYIKESNERFSTELCTGVLTL